MAQEDLSATNQKPTIKSVPVVAVGASAGGIEAITELLQNLSPTTGLAYVYIQHLDEKQESQLASVLGRATDMPVAKAEHSMRIEPNHVYVIPPDQDLEIIDGVLVLTPRTRNKSFIHMPIDQFFVSLAERQKEGAIAIVLSGTASDGTLGLRAIKVAGGITFAQDETARFQSMPRSAITEGVVDMVLSPTAIAKELERLSQQLPIFQQSVQVEPDSTDDVSMPDKLEQLDLTPIDTADYSEEIKTVTQILRKSVGVDFSHYKITTVRRRIIRRMLLFKLDTLTDYIQYLKLHPDEVSLLYNDLLINVTTFFRDDDTMDYLEKVLLPRLIKDKTAREPVRIWVPACLTGQEAYSLAILLLEALGNQGTNRPIQIFATDLSENAVAKARQGSYTRGEVMDVSPRRLQRFFTKVDDHYRINRNVRDLCVFAPHNVLKDPPFSRLDLVSCRNLLIYLDNVYQRKAIATFHYALNPSGYLVLGKSETVGASAALFTQLEKNYKVYARKNDIASRAVFEMSPRTPLVNAPDGSDTDLISAEGTKPTIIPPILAPTNDLEAMVDALLLRQYVPASVVVNQDLDILQFRGSTSLFLEPAPGKASLNLLKMARPSLAFELRNTVSKARKAQQTVRKTGLEVKIRDKTHHVAIEVVPLKSNAEEQLFLVIFEEITPTVATGINSPDARDRRIKQLEEELATLREDMRSIIEEQEASNEELQSANEEIISSNEELQSINEELETSKEEIESTNEELLTINQELQVRNDQLSEANDFSEAIFSTIREATLILDEDLRVKSANPTFYKLFKVTPDETEGRLIYQLGSQQWDIPQLRLLLSNIILHNAQVEGFEVTHTFPELGEKVLLLNARRVIRQEESILLAIEDITEHRQAQRLLKEREAWLQSVVENAPTLIWIADVNGHYTYFNKVWLEYTGRSMETVIEQGWKQNLHPDDQDEYAAVEEARFRDRQPSQTNYRLQRHDGEFRAMMENALPTFAPDGTFTGFIGTAVDVHLQNEQTKELERRVQERTEKLERLNTTISQMLQGSIVAISLFEAVRERTEDEDSPGRIIDFVWRGVNRAAEVMAQKTESELLGQRMLALSPGVQPVFFDDYVRVVETGEPLRYKRQYKGEHFDTWFDLSVVKNGDGIILSYLDITEQKRAEEEIVKNLTLMQQSEELANIGSWEYDRVTGRFSWSEGMYRLFDKEPGSEVKLEAYLDTATEEDKPAAQRVIDFLKQGEGNFEETMQIVGRDAVKTLQIKAAVNDDQPHRVLGIDLDITNVQRAEEQIRQTADYLQAVLDSSPASVAFMKAVHNDQQEVVDFRLVVCNQRFADLVGEPIDQLIGESVHQLTHALWEGATFSKMVGVLTTGQPSYVERYGQGTDKDRWTGMSVSKEDHGIVLSGLDITALRQAEQQQDQLLQELERSQENIQALEQLRRQIRERGDFLRTTTHDLRSGFGLISGAATLLNLTDTDEDRAQMLSLLQRNMNQMTQMLSQLLDYSRLEAGQEQLHIAPFDVGRLMRELSEQIRPLARDRGLALISDGPDSLIVDGDEVKVQRILQNLLMNAINYTESGQVTLTWGPDDTADRWTFSVQDTGPGLPAGLISRLTDQSTIDEPFSNKLFGARLMASEGIGLFIVKQLCKLLGASLQIDSAPDTGTIFRITLPGKN